MGCAALVKAHALPQVPVSPSVTVRDLIPGRGWGRAGSEALLGFSRSSPAGGAESWQPREAGSAPTPGEGAAGSGTPCGPRSASQCRRSRPAGRVPGRRPGRLNWAQDYVTGEKGNESSLPGAVRRPRASAESRLQETGTMAGSERNVGLASAAGAASASDAGPCRASGD